jgi:hypothetical protein
MGIEEKTQYAPEYWQEKRDRQALFCLGNFLPGKAFERWWVYGLVSDNDSRSSYRHTFGSRFDYDGRFPVPSYGRLRSKRAMLQYLHARGVYLKLLKWGSFRSAQRHHLLLDQRTFHRSHLTRCKPKGINRH